MITGCSIKEATALVPTEGDLSNATVRYTLVIQIARELDRAYLSGLSGPEVWELDYCGRVVRSSSETRFGL